MGRLPFMCRSCEEPCTRLFFLWFLWEYLPVRSLWQVPCVLTLETPGCGRMPVVFFSHCHSGAVRLRSERGALGRANFRMRPGHVTVPLSGLDWGCPVLAGTAEPWLGRAGSGPDQ